MNERTGNISHGFAEGGRRWADGSRSLATASWPRANTSWWRRETWNSRSSTSTAAICCIEDLCTHDGGNLVEGDFDGRVVTCPRHGAKFDVCTGEALCLPAVASTPVHAVRVRDGAVEVEVEDE